MKIGVRKPNLKSRVKARTTGRIKRSVKRTIDPTYGKKGMGWVKDPKKAAYNKIYNKTTVGIGTGSTRRSGQSPTDSVSHTGRTALTFSGTKQSSPSLRPAKRFAPPKSKRLFIAIRVLCVILGLLAAVLCLVEPLAALLVIAVAVVGWFTAKIYLPDNSTPDEEESP